MEILRSISKLSNYRPKGGLKAILYNLVKQEGYSRKAAKAFFKEQKKEGQFSVVYKRLKYDLMDGLLLMSFDKYSKATADTIKIWKRLLQTKILFKIENKKAGIKQAIHTVVMAEKNNEWEVVLSLCRELMIQYSIVNADIIKYKKYLVKYESANQYLQEEIKAEKIYQDLILCQHTKKSIQHIPAKIEALEQIVKRNQQSKFRYLYYSIKNLYYQLNQEDTNLIINCHAAFQFFDSLEQDLPYHTKLNFLIKMIPYYILKKEFIEARDILDRCIELPPAGSINWHIILQYQCYFGFYINDLEIALAAYQKAFSMPIKFESSELLEKWYFFYGYLAFYAKIGRIKWDKPFQLGRFLNIQEEQGNEAQKINLLIIELLHLLADNKRAQYLNRIAQIEPYLSNRFKKRCFKRSRYFLRMLKSVVRGNYRASLVSAHAHPQLNKLNSTAVGLDTTVFDREIVPYELLWESVLATLTLNHNRKIK